MSYIVLRKLNDFNVQSRRGKLSQAVERAEDLIAEGLETELIVCKETCNREARKKDWMQPAWKRELVCEVKK